MGRAILLVLGRGEAANSHSQWMIWECPCRYLECLAVDGDGDDGIGY
jgi:hypothetical protein